MGTMILIIVGRRSSCVGSVRIPNARMTRNYDVLSSYQQKLGTTCNDQLYVTLIICPVKSILVKRLLY